MSDPEASLLGFRWGPAGDCAVCSAAGLVVAFAQMGDRWTHSLALAIDRSEAPIARAVEGSPDRDGPARVISPVYQEARLHDPGGSGSEAGAFLLLTGQSFAHHFSAVVGRVDDGEGAEALDFDVADRCRAPIEGLAATYEMDLDRLELVDAAPDRAFWSVGVETRRSPAARLELRALEGCAIAMDQAGPRAWRVQIVAPIGQGAFTHRLRYRWRRSSSTG